MTDLGDNLTIDNLDQDEKNRKGKKPKANIIRPENENPYSDDDIDYFDAVPE